MGPLGWQETLFIFVLALLLFGPKKLPELGRQIGKALTEFRRASSELKATFDRELSSLERENESIKEIAGSYGDPYHQTYDHSYESSYYDAGTQSSPSSESTATATSTVSASATQGAEPHYGTAPEGTVATSPNGGQHSATDQPQADPASAEPAHGAQSAES